MTRVVVTDKYQKLNLYVHEHTLNITILDEDNTVIPCV